MDKLMYFYFELDNINLFCVGSEPALNDLVNHCEIQTQNNMGVDFRTLLNRAVNQGVYCFIRTANLMERFALREYIKKLKEHGKWIEWNEVSQAIILVKPDEAKSMMGISDADIESLRKHSFWKGKFAY